MKAPIGLIFALCLAFSLRAQAPATGSEYTPEQLDQLLAPIALYPDPLIALILPASTVPSDISLAAQYLAANGAPSGIDSQPWDPSVKGPGALPRRAQVDERQPRLDARPRGGLFGAAVRRHEVDPAASGEGAGRGNPRRHAPAAGRRGGRRHPGVPAQPDTIYVPEYDPDLVYGDAPDGYAGPFITFGVGFPVGAWLGFECDWDDFGIWVRALAPGMGLPEGLEGSALRRPPLATRPPSRARARAGLLPARAGRPEARGPWRAQGSRPRGPAACLSCAAGAGPRSRPNYRGYGEAAPRPRRPRRGANCTAGTAAAPTPEHTAPAGRRAGALR